MDARYQLDIPAGTPQRLTTAWLALAVSSLAVSTVFALSLSIARTPVVGRLLPGVDLYHTALVLHVDLAVLILFLAHAAVLWSAVTLRRGSLVQWAAFGFAVLGTVAMALSPFVASGPAVLSNYVPVLDNPVFLTGIGCFALALVLAAAMALTRGWPKLEASDSGTVLRWGIYLSILPLLMALLSLGWMLLELPRTGQEAYLEKLLWGPGHLMQFNYVLIMMVTWLLLAGARGAAVPVSPRAVLVCFALTALPVLLTPLLHLLFPADGSSLRHAYTQMMAFTLWPAAAWLGFHLLVGTLRAGGGYTPARASLITSITLFLFGCIAGALVSSNNVMITGHYHGTIGAVALALMGIAMYLLPQLGFSAPQSRMARWQPVIYGSGLLLMALGLVGSGFYNVQRKVPGSGLMSADPATLVTLAVVGVGSLIAFAGMLGCALPVLASLLRGKPDAAQTSPRRADNRPRALALTLLLVVIGGFMLDHFNSRLSQPPVARSYAIHSREKVQAEIMRNFQQGVAMLSAKRYFDAVAAFHRVLELDPELPEAHVNMGFALLGLERYGAAADFFDSATMLRPRQVNAYWGMAIAQERGGSLGGAVQTLHTFIHLSKPDDPFTIKAKAMLSEWEPRFERERIEKSQSSNAAQPAAEGK